MILLTSQAPRGKRVSIIVEVSSLVGRLDISPSCCSESIKLGGESRLRLDERGSIVSHRLIASIRVLGEESVEGRDKHQDQQGQGEDCVDDEEYDTHNTNDKTLGKD